MGLNRGASIVAALWLFAAACGGGGGGSGGGGGGIGLEDIDGDGQILIIAFGDSLTRGTGDGPEASSVPPGTGGYPPRLQTLLGVQVFNLGRPGELTDDGRERLRSVLSESRSDYVIILEGTNDITGGRDRSRTIPNLQDMIDAVFADGGQPLIGTVTPTCCDHVNAVPPARVTSLNDDIRTLALDNDVPLIDFYAAFVPDPTLPFDETSGLIHVPEGLHPTPGGYDLMASTVEDVFR
ncbi:MAG: SGNH/GDSL hydrolase family protein [Candidatus Binatia bacterium]